VFNEHKEATPPTGAAAPGRALRLRLNIWLKVERDLSLKRNK
jgi:hypothetical protein